jgi:hypothetical protein
MEFSDGEAFLWYAGSRILSSALPGPFKRSCRRNPARTYLPVSAFFSAIAALLCYVFEASGTRQSFSVFHPRSRLPFAVDGQCLLKLRESTALLQDLTVDPRHHGRQHSFFPHPPRYSCSYLIKETRHPEVPRCWRGDHTEPGHVRRQDGPQGRQTPRQAGEQFNILWDKTQTILDGGTLPGRLQSKLVQIGNMDLRST